MRRRVGSGARRRRARAVTKRTPARVVAIGQRDARVGRRADRGRDARHDFERDAGAAQHPQFLAAAAEDERVAALEAHDRAAAARVFDQQGVDPRLRHRRAAAFLADVDARRRRDAPAPARRPTPGRRAARRRLPAARAVRAASAAPDRPGRHRRAARGPAAARDRALRAAAPPRAPRRPRRRGRRAPGARPSPASASP